MARKFSLRTPVTPAEAHIVWDSLDGPSARRVAKALTQSGRPVHFTTVARWRRDDWRGVIDRPHPLEEAERAVDVSMPLLTGDPTITAAQFLQAHLDDNSLQEITEEDHLTSSPARGSNVDSGQRTGWRALHRIDC